MERKLKNIVLLPIMGILIGLSIVLFLHNSQAETLQKDIAMRRVPQPVKYVHYTECCDNINKIPPTCCPKTSSAKVGGLRPMSYFKTHRPIRTCLSNVMAGLRVKLQNMRNKNF